MHCRFVGRSHGITIQTPRMHSYEMQMQVLEGWNKRFACTVPAFSELSSPSWLINTPIHAFGYTLYLYVYIRAVWYLRSSIDTSRLCPSTLSIARYHYTSSSRSLDIIRYNYPIICSHILLRKIQSCKTVNCIGRRMRDNYNRLLTAKKLILILRDTTPMIWHLLRRMTHIEKWHDYKFRHTLSYYYTVLRSHV